MVEQGLALACSADLTFRVRLLSAQLGHIYVNVGRLDEGTALLETAVEPFATMGHAAFRSLRVGWHSDAYPRAGRPEEARRLAEQTMALATRHGETANRARALRLLAEAVAGAAPLGLSRSAVSVPPPAGSEPANLTRSAVLAARSDLAHAARLKRTAS